MADSATIVIYDQVIDSWSLPGGMVWRWARQRAVKVERLAKSYAPKRSGEMASSIAVEYEGSRKSHVEMNVYCGSEHALFVHEGTTGPIWAPESGPPFHLPPWGQYGWTVTRMVSGQQAQPFLADALNDVMRDL